MHIINRYNPTIINQLYCLNLNSNEVTSDYLLLCTDSDYLHEIDKNKNYNHIFLLVPDKTIIYSKFVIEIKDYNYNCISYTIYKDKNNYQLFTLLKTTPLSDTFSTLFGD